MKNPMHEHHTDACGCGHGHHHEHHSCESEPHSTHCGCEHPQGHHEDAHLSADSCKFYILNNLGCANCAAKMEERIRRLSGVADADITFATKKLRIWFEDGPVLIETLQDICSSIEPDVRVTPEDLQPAGNAPSRKRSFLSHNRELTELITGLVLFIAGEIFSHLEPLPPFYLVCLATAYLILGGKILRTALKHLSRGHIFDENFLMSIATIGAIVIQNYAEAVGVMLFYRIGEYFEDRAVDKSRAQITGALDMRPETVQLYTANGTRELPAKEARPGDRILIRPGDRIPLDGKILEGNSRLDTSAITGEPVPVTVKAVIASPPDV